MNRRDALKQTIFFGGLALSAPTLMSVLTACGRSDGTPATLNQKQANTIAELVDTILPATDTPGAKELKVDVFIGRVIDRMMPPAEQEAMRHAVDRFNGRARERFGKDYPELSQTQRQQMLEQEERDSGTYNPQIWGGTIGEQKPVGFYRQLKSLALWGYFSSEYIGKNVLIYDLVPGEQKGCIPLSQVGNSWSL
ncbi:gluconate 2-dehydrogenase subunit 3 family protein [Marinimicrobium sp. ABcell2]|uniref:gluconate 2-dehydrogenase subunit 3 family protein n=1 Tax=Marinimicrobium sp. ABcell2 TaxID=3069751 RepID=UPI0027B60073|nr:gluconate 2-dehydrogenase subunit 3 family protein [Marinimicrobium sp. ABcell2]MDQ2077045.1 gluconate 2-dehydrogenase subunit 3 family protein [Marinimicrobium sp. ABcell2]